MERNYFLSKEFRNGPEWNPEIRRSENQKETYRASYRDIKREAETHGQKLPILLQDVEAAAMRYQETILRFSLARKGDTASIEESDSNRHYAHERLVDALNILSRGFHGAGLNNEWRRDLLNREAAGLWGTTVAQLIYRQYEDKRG
ncbi:MAG: hypothetical protein AAB539_02010 [Patescibacteria group bacterium]